DLKQTDVAIRQIEALGASTGQVRLLRGMVAYFRSDSEDAIRELEQAVNLLPQSVAARALLAIVYDGQGQYTSTVQKVREMEELLPVSAEDYIFKGYAKELTDHGGAGVADLNEGLRLRDSPIGRAFRAFVLCNRAVDTADKTQLEIALDDAKTA